MSKCAYVCLHHTHCLCSLVSPYTYSDKQQELVSKYTYSSSLTIYIFIREFPNKGGIVSQLRGTKILKQVDKKAPSPGIGASFGAQY